ncbi:response regulator [Neobacillus drentensis]|uniref:response regulator transcription factor n=1 Tax=Neobacillus drentensis TaxID=220684 RepID=UPI001F28553B|nr:response regulator [Neobacillus drentensis]ULT57333.1 response regulator [Neobacillus drentensis]
MIKLLIADDEPKILRGLKKSLDWEELNIEIVGEAEDGEIAFEMAKQQKPDILFLDINMPFLNGLKLIEKLNSELPLSVVIVISGYDEFSYAQEAIRLGVFQYLLKPVNTEELRKVVTEAVQLLEERKKENHYKNWINEKLDKNSHLIKQTFLSHWMKGKLTENEIQEHIAFLDMNFHDIWIFAAKPMIKVTEGKKAESWDQYLLYFTLQNFMEDLLSNYESMVVFNDEYKQIIAFVPCLNTDQIHSVGPMIEEMFERHTGKNIFFAKRAFKLNQNMPELYQGICEEISSQSRIVPVVLLAKKYIERNYYRQDLTLQEVAEEVRVSPTYLSRLLKEELGSSFIDYLTRVRIENAIEYMGNPVYKMYEVAEKVGYSTQHYFSTAFKKVIGVSPSAYAKRWE